MMKKYSNDPIPSIVDLGDGKYEFCWNFQQEQLEGRISYSSDVIIVEGNTPDKQNIIAGLIAEGLIEADIAVIMNSNFATNI
jgi:hypothetical protein